MGALSRQNSTAKACGIYPRSLPQTGPGGQGRLLQLWRAFLHLSAKKIGDGGCPAAIRHTDMLTPVIILNSSPETCCKLPLPLDPMLILPGLALA